MKHTMKRVLALMIALVLVIPGVAFSDEVFIDEIVIDDAAVPEDVAIDGDLLSIEDLNLFGEEVGNIDLENLPDTGLEAGLVCNASESPAPVAFEQTANVGGCPVHRDGERGRVPGGGRVERGSG